MSTEKLHPDLSAFVALLNARNVEYLIVGARALAFFGVPRMTGDLDFLFSASSENTTRLIGVLEEYGFDSHDLTAEDLQASEMVLQLGYPPNRIDLLNTLTGVSFEEAWRDRQAGELDGIPVSYLSRDHFIANKRALGRPKDLADIDAVLDVD